VSSPLFAGCGSHALGKPLRLNEESIGLDSEADARIDGAVENSGPPDVVVDLLKPFEGARAVGSLEPACNEFVRPLTFLRVWPIEFLAVNPPSARACRKADGETDEEADHKSLHGAVLARFRAAAEGSARAERKRLRRGGGGLLEQVGAAGLASDDYPNGVWWVPLAAVRDPELVLPAAAQILQAKRASPSSSSTGGC
jgi:hypothetical protein